jgi:DNA transformation protein
MPVSEGFRGFVLDQLEGLGGVHARAMFGGVGVYADDLFFGIIASDMLYFKVDASNRAAYEAAGMSGSKPYPDRPDTMAYYQVPVCCPPELSALTRRVFRVRAGPQAEPILRAACPSGSCRSHFWAATPRA